MADSKPDDLPSKDEKDRKDQKVESDKNEEIGEEVFFKLRI